MEKKNFQTHPQFSLNKSKGVTLMFPIHYLAELSEKRELIKAEVQVENYTLSLNITRTFSEMYAKKEGKEKILLRSWKRGIEINPGSGVAFHQFPIPTEGWEITEER